MYILVIGVSAMTIFWMNCWNWDFSDPRLVAEKIEENGRRHYFKSPDSCCFSFQIREILFYLGLIVLD